MKVAQQLSTASFVPTGRKNNWPPLPEKFPVGPCFYHDIAVDIPVEFQKTVKIMYNLWMCKWTIQHAFKCISSYTDLYYCLFSSLTQRHTQVSLQVKPSDLQHFSLLILKSLI